MLINFVFFEVSNLPTKTRTQDQNAKLAWLKKCCDTRLKCKKKNLSKIGLSHKTMTRFKIVKNWLTIKTLMQDKKALTGKVVPKLYLPPNLFSFIWFQHSYHSLPDLPTHFGTTEPPNWAVDAEVDMVAPATPHTNLTQRLEQSRTFFLVVWKTEPAGLAEHYPMHVRSADSQRWKSQEVMLRNCDLKVSWSSAEWLWEYQTTSECGLRYPEKIKNEEKKRCPKFGNAIL